MKDKITIDEVKHISDLSKLELSKAELDAMCGHLQKMLDYFETLDRVDTSNVPPTAHILGEVNVLRDDVVAPSMPNAELIANAPEAEDGAYIVPRVVE